MPTQSPDAQADDLIAELGFLRKGEGFTARRLSEAWVVKALLVQNASEEFGRLRSRFVSAIHSLEDSDAELLLDVYGLSTEAAGHRSLLERRRVHAARIGRGVDTVANRERTALERLAQRLTRGTYAQSPLVIDVPEMHDGIIYEMTSTLIVVENRHWKQTREHYRFVATFAEMDFVTITRSYAAHASVPSDGQFHVNTRPTSHGFNDHFWSRDATGADSPMRRGETYDLKFVLEPVGDSEPMRNAYRAFHERSLLASIRVAFIGERPAQVWKQERVSHFAWPGEPNDRNVIEVDEKGLASLRLRDVHGGLVSGIAWTW